LIDVDTPIMAVLYGILMKSSVSDMHSHLLSCLHVDLSKIESFNCP